MMDVTYGFVAILYSFLIILVTADFIINLILAVFIEAFKKEQINLDKEKLAELEAEEALQNGLDPQPTLQKETSIKPEPTSKASELI